ncbi:MAG: hypothetical protein Kow001_08320 [Acidobacteriota bacterium]
MNNRLRSPTWALGLALALTTLVHAPGIVPALSGDDFVHVYRNRPDSVAWVDLFVKPDGREYRPLVRSSLLIDSRLWASRFEGFHLTNLSLHLANTALLFLLVMSYGISAPGAFTAAALLGLHPIHSYSVHAVMGRTDLLSTLFALAALLAATHRSNLGAAGSTLGAVLSKENGVVVPLLLAARYWLLRRAGRQDPDLDQSFRPVAASAAVVLTYLSLRWALAPPNLTDLAPYLQLRPPELAKNLILSLGALVVPAGHLRIRIWLEAAPAMILGAAAGVLVAAGGILLWRFRSRLRFPESTRFGVTWVVIALLPYLSLFQRRFLYMSSAGMALAVGGLLDRVRSLRLRFGVTGTLLAVLAVASVHSSLRWRAAGAESASLVREIAEQVAHAPADVWWVMDTPNGREEAHLFTHDSLRYAVGIELGRLPEVSPVIRLQLAAGSAPRIDRQSSRSVGIRLRPELGEWFVFDAPEVLERGGRFLKVGTRMDRGPFRIEVTAADSWGRVSEVTVSWTDLPPGHRVLFVNWGDTDGA